MEVATFPTTQAKKAETAAGAPEKVAKAIGELSLQDDSQEELDPSLYFENRVKALKVWHIPTKRLVWRGVRSTTK